MNLLLDTHILIWALNEDPRLPDQARELILDENNAVYYSSVSVWEIAIKHANYPEEVEFTGRELSQFCQEAGFLPVEMREKHVFAIRRYARHTAERSPTPKNSCTASSRR